MKMKNLVKLSPITNNGYFNVKYLLFSVLAEFILYVKCNVLYIHTLKHHENSTHENYSLSGLGIVSFSGR